LVSIREPMGEFALTAAFGSDASAALLITLMGAGRHPGERSDFVRRHGRPHPGGEVSCRG